MFFKGMTSTIAGRRRRAVAAAGFLTLLILLAIAAPAAAQASNKPIKTKLLQDMEFGSVVATAPTGTVTLYPSGQSPLYSGVIPLGGVVSPAEFQISGEKLQPFTIILPVTPVIIPGPTGNMVIDDFVSEPPAGANGMFNAQGKAIVTVGATMYMTDQLSAGPYNSTFDLIVSY